MLEVRNGLGFVMFGMVLNFYVLQNRPSSYLFFALVQFWISICVLILSIRGLGVFLGRAELSNCARSFNKFCLGDIIKLISGTLTV